MFQFLVRLKISDKLPTPKNKYQLRHFTVKTIPAIHVSDTEDSPELYRILERLYIIVFMSSLHLCTAVTRYGIVKLKKNAYSGWYYQRDGVPLTSYLHDSRWSSVDNLLKLISSVYNWYKAFNHYNLYAIETSPLVFPLDIFAVDPVSETSTFLNYDDVVLSLKQIGYNKPGFSVARVKSEIGRILQGSRISHPINMDNLRWDPFDDNINYDKDDTRNHLWYDVFVLKSYFEDTNITPEALKSKYTIPRCEHDVVQPIRFIQDTFKSLVPQFKPDSCILNLFSKTLGHTTQISPPSSVYNHIQEFADDDEVCLISNAGAKLHCEPRSRIYQEDHNNVFKNLVNRVRRSCSMPCRQENEADRDEARRAACDTGTFDEKLRPLSTKFPENRFFVPVVDSFMRTLGHYQIPKLQDKPSGRPQLAAADTHTARIIFPDVILDKDLREACPNSRCTQMFTLSLTSLAAGNFNEEVMKSRLGADTFTVLEKMLPES